MPETGMMELPEIQGQEMIEADIGGYRGRPAVKNGDFLYHLLQRRIGIGEIINKSVQPDALYEVRGKFPVLLRIQFAFDIVATEISHYDLRILSRKGDMSEEIHEAIRLGCKKNFNKNRENKPYTKNMYIFAIEAAFRNHQEAAFECYKLVYQAPCK